MSTPEDRLVSKLPLIQNALEVALTDAAGERMGFVLMIVPLNRVGEHVLTSNIAEKRTVVRFMRDAARTLATSWKAAELQAEQMAARGLN